MSRNETPSWLRSKNSEAKDIPLVRGANELINAGGVYLILGVQVGCLIDRRPFKKGRPLFS